MKINRIRRIQEMLEESRSLSINYLCDTFEVSKNTIRRDIAELEKTGLIKKVYGGIVLQERDSHSPEPYFSREGRNTQQKKRIAKLAASMVQDNDVIYIDSGTTTMHMMPFLEDKRNLTIVTASVYIINAASCSTKFNVIAAGGSLYSPSKAFVGSSVISCLRSYNVNKVFLASTGISIDSGVTNVNPLECEIKRTLVEKPAKKILMVDSSKFDRPSLMTFCQIKDIDCIITDKETPREFSDYCNVNGVRLLIAD